MYYYLISGLPDLTLAMDPRRLDFEEIYDTIQRNLSPEDLVPYRYLWYQNDNKNLISTFFRESYGRDLRPFSRPSVFSPEEIRDYRRQQARFPVYLSHFLEVYGEQAREVPLHILSRRLQGLFLDEVQDIDEPFILSYLQFERTLQDVLATYHQEKFPFLPHPELDTDPALLKHVGPGKTVPTKMGKSFPYLESLMEALQTEDPLKLEREVDQIYWDFVDEFTGYFGRHQVYAYTVKLMMIQRWYALDNSGDTNDFQSLTEEIKRVSREPKTVEL